jgi:hypothetical protein
MSQHGAAISASSRHTRPWTLRGLVTYYTAFVIELHSGRVLCSVPTP